MKKEFCGIEILWNNQNIEFQTNGSYVESQKEYEGKTVNDLELNFDLNREVLKWFIVAHREKRNFKIFLNLNEKNKLETRVSQVGFIVNSNFDNHVTLIDLI